MKDLLDCRTRRALITALKLARVWKVLLAPSREEFSGTPGRGYCGFIAMDRIINGMNRTINTDTNEGISEIVNITSTLIQHSKQPLRHNWTNIGHQHRSPREALEATKNHLLINRSNWISLQQLPEKKWLNGGSLLGNCKMWDFSRWSLGPASGTLLSMEESQFQQSTQACSDEWIKILQSNMLCHERHHFYTRSGGLEEDFLIAVN